MSLVPIHPCSRNTLRRYARASIVHNSTRDAASNCKGHRYRRDLSHAATRRCTPVVSALSFQYSFINALVCAGVCRAHRTVPSIGPQYRRSTSASAAHQSLERQANVGRHPVANQPQYFSSQWRQATRDELRKLLDYYSRSTATTEDDPYASVFYVNPGTTDTEEPPAMPPDTSPQVEHIRAALKKLVYSPTPPDLDELYELYKQLPSPGTSYLTHRQVHKLLAQLSVVEHKSERSAMRYLSVIDDAKTSNIPLTTAEWTSAIAFAGRCYTVVSAKQVEHALHIWKELEATSGVRSNAVTFGLMFDIATKAGKFALADVIAEEMRLRKLPYTRYFRVGLIYHNGLRRDSDGVRAAYCALVDAGEVVDTVVINALIAALLSCGEATAAEHVLARADALSANIVGSHFGSAQQAPDWRQARLSGKKLARTSQRLAKNEEARTMLQKTVSLAPDLRTYKLLIYHYAVQAGDLDRVTALLAEVRARSLPYHGSFWIYLLKGFTNHGGVRYSRWTKARLEDMWNALKGALSHTSGTSEQLKSSDCSTNESVVTPQPTDTFSPASHLDIILRGNKESPLQLPKTGPPPVRTQVYLSRTLASVLLRAFARCADETRTREVWSELQVLWRLNAITGTRQVEGEASSTTSEHASDITQEDMQPKEGSLQKATAADVEAIEALLTTLFR